MYLVNFSRLAFGAIAIAACPFSSAAKAENLGQATRLMLAQDKRFLFEYSYTQRSEEMPDSDIGKRQRLLPRISGVSTINDIIPPIQIIPIAFPAPPAVPVLPPANPVVLVVPRATQLRQVSESHSASATAKVTKHFGMSLKSSYVRDIPKRCESDHIRRNCNRMGRHAALCFLETTGRKFKVGESRNRHQPSNRSYRRSLQA